MTTNEPLNAIERSFRDAVCEEVTLVQSGIERYIVNSPFHFEDGDHFVVLLKRIDGDWTLTDEGHTFMHLSYDVPQFDQGNRWSIIERALAGSGVENSDGEILLPVPGEDFGDALFTFLQALTRVSDVTYLSREHVRNTFMEDFKSLIIDTGSTGRFEIELDYHSPLHDPELNYPVDARINGSADRPALVFAVGNNDQCRDATIILNRWESWGERFHSVAIFRDQTEISRTVLARFSDVVDNQYSSLDSARERLDSYLSDALRH